MATAIVVTGASGRMGNILTGLAMGDGDFELAGVVARSACRKIPGGFACASGTSLDEVLPRVPGAVVVDFTSPDATVAAAEACARHGNPLVAGATGLDKDQLDVLRAAASTVPVFWSPNMSIGVNVLLTVLPQLAAALGDGYDMEMVELHHNRKQDAPSGTALRLAECLAEARGWNPDTVGRYCREGIIGARPHGEIGVQTIRGGDVVGVHTCYFLGPGERIEVTHQAHSRENFARGALRAAAWIGSQEPGKLYEMTDLLFG